MLSTIVSLILETSRNGSDRWRALAAFFGGLCERVEASDDGTNRFASCQGAWIGRPSSPPRQSFLQATCSTLFSRGSCFNFMIWIERFSLCSVSLPVWFEFTCHDAVRLPWARCLWLSAPSRMFALRFMRTEAWAMYSSIVGQNSVLFPVHCPDSVSCAQILLWN